LKPLGALFVLTLLAWAPAVAVSATPPAGPDSLGMDWSQVPEYRIVPGDKLSIDLGPKADAVQEYVHEVVVRSDGRITVYPIGDVVAAGLTPMELQHSLTDLLAAVLRAPRVTVELVSSAANLVHVLGRVQKPGSYPALSFMTLSQAVASAGGFENDASRNDVLLIRRNGARTVSVQRVKLGRTLAGASLDDPMLSRFDIVYVPRNSVGNLNQFTSQLFGGLAMGSQTALMGWELFNLDRVFSSRLVRQ
jgi:polysaccharide export outer membrane protein